MWIEKTPEVGDTVKVEFAEFSNLGTMIGVLKFISVDGYYVTDFGNRVMYLEKYSNFLVYEK